jgi:hypothetical protein
MNKKIKAVPEFKSEREERELWHTRDTTDYFDFFQVKAS